MNEAGILGRTGKPWTEGRLSKLVHCPTYKGTHIFRGRDGVLSREVPAIIPAEVWDAAHVQLKGNSVQRPTYRFNLLRGKIRCMNCGGRYIGVKKVGGHKVYYRCIRSIRSGPKHCRSASVNAPALESYVWAECLTLLGEPGRISAYASSTLLDLEEAEADRETQGQSIQEALVKLETAKQRIIRLVKLGKITDEDVENELDSINTEVGNLHAQLCTLDSSQSFAREYARKLHMAEALVRRIARGVDAEVIDLNNQDHQRRIVDTLLHGMEVKTIGEGRERRVELTFKWIGMEPTGLLDPQEWRKLFIGPIDEDGFPVEEDPYKPGVLTSRLSAVLTDATPSTDS
jgi:Recombinase zinc beta ribbon domain/Recombinase